jgi:hypothetical protein
MMMKIFIALGNDRPQILVQLEDRVLHAILAISEGKSPEDVISNLYAEIFSLEKDLGNDHDALNWFDWSTPAFSIPPTPPASKFPSTPLAGVQICLI